MSELPEGWIKARLGDVCIIIRGITFPASAKQFEATQENVCCLRTSNIQREIDWEDIYFVPRGFVKRDDQFVRLGDILMSMANSYELVGKVAVVRQLPYETAFGAFLSAVRPKDWLDGQYLFHFLRTDQVQQELRAGSSQTVNIANISVKTLSTIDTPLAPLAEQKRIADKLDTLLARVDACRERLDLVPRLLKRFRQAVLAAATSGELTESQDTKGTEEKTLSDVLEHLKTGPFGSSLHKSDYVSNGIPVVNPMHINDGKITPTSDMTISPSKAKELSEFVLTPGDMVIARRGVMGRCAVITRREEGWLCGTGSMFLKPKPFVLPKYLQLFLSSPSTVEALEADAVGSTMVNLNQKILLNLKIHVPTLAEQHEIVRRVEALFAFADRIEARYAAARKHADKLTPALLAKAFRGELVPQDPNDEPASVLLERIRAEREAKANAKPTQGALFNGVTKGKRRR